MTRVGYGPMKSDVRAVGNAHHVGVNVADLQEARDFYSELLGLPEVRSWNPDIRQARIDGLYRLPGFDMKSTAVTVAYFGAGEQFLELVEYGVPASSFSTAPGKPNAIGRVHVSFRVVGMPYLFTALEPHCRFLSRPVMSSTGGMMVKCLDPSGNVVEFTEDAGSRLDTSRILGIDHVGVNVPDLDDALAFYSGMLGWRLSRRYVPRLSVDAFVSGIESTHAVTEVAFLEAGNFKVELLQYPRSETVETSEFDVGRAHIGISVVSVGEVVRRLGSSVSWLSEPVRSPSGTMVVKGRDPCGYTVELIEPGPWLRGSSSRVRDIAAAGSSAEGSE
jgi:catechol 2,3-dioxygenase-like lactoylglutathione lyase family enzyme